MDPTALAAAPSVTTEFKSDAEVNTLRFWRRNFMGSGNPVGQIAGRETLLYQSQDNRPDGQITLQAWVDAENKTVAIPGSGILLTKSSGIRTVSLLNPASETSVKEAEKEVAK